MPIGARDAYVESQVLEADGCQLVRLMYRKALESLAEARRSLSSGQIGARSRAITRTSEILNELALAVDHESGGEVGRNLVELYDYVQSLLQEANFQQADAPLSEAQSLLQTLLEAWEQCTAAVSPLPREDPSVAERSPLDCVA